MYDVEESIFYLDRVENIWTDGRNSGSCFLVLLLNGRKCRSFTRDVVVVQNERRIRYATPVFRAHVLLLNKTVMIRLETHKLFE